MKIIRKIQAGALALAIAAGTMVATAPAANAELLQCQQGYVWYRFGGGPTRANINFNRASFCLNSYDQYGAKLVFQSDGNLVQYRNGVARWQSGTANTGTLLALQNDGNVVVYGADGSAKWQSGTTGSTRYNLHQIEQLANNVNNAIYRLDSNNGYQTLLWKN